MKLLSSPFWLICYIIFISLFAFQAKAQYTIHNSPMLDVMAIDSFNISYSIGIKKDSGIIETDTFSLVKYDSSLSYHIRNFDVITNGKYSMVVQHKSKRMIFGPKAPKFFDQYIQIQLNDTNKITSIDSTDTISGYRIYNIVYDSIPACPSRTKVVKLNLQTGFADEIILKISDKTGSYTTSIFKILSLQINGLIAPPTAISQFLYTSGLPANWVKNPQFISYLLINYF